MLNLCDALQSFCAKPDSIIAHGRHGSATGRSQVLPGSFAQRLHEEPARPTKHCQRGVKQSWLGRIGGLGHLLLIHLFGLDAQTERYTSTIALYSAGWSVFINVQSLLWVLTSLFVSSARHTCGPKIVSGTFLKTCQLMRDYQVISVQNVACITMIRCKIDCNCKTIPQYRSKC